ncbi:LOW QUALITY PROTEIN: solute carrier family 22 member 14-like [Erethizon dorsatum]
MLLKTINNKGVKFVNILHAMGEFGKFQRRLVALVFICSILLGFMYAEYFVFTDQERCCNTTWILAVGPNLSEAEQLNLTLPACNGSFLTCLRYLPVPWDLDSVIQFGLSHTATCQDGIYPKSKTRSLINEFDLVCGEEPVEESLQSISMAGFLTGSLVFGFINDTLGRYPAILMSLLGLTIFNFRTAFASSLHQHFFFCFLVSQAVMGYTISTTEWLVGNHRAHAILLEHCFISVGALFLMGLSYSLPHWPLFLVGGAPMFLFIFYIWFTDSYIYFTLTLKMREFGMNVHFRQALSSIMKIVHPAAQREMAQNFEDTSRKMNSDAMEMTMADDSTSDMSEEAAKNMILNAQILRLDVDISSNTALEQSAPEEAHRQAP